MPPPPGHAVASHTARVAPAALSHSSASPSASPAASMRGGSTEARDAAPVLDEIEAAVDSILCASRELWFADSYHLQLPRVRGRTTLVQDCYDPHTDVPLVVKYFTNRARFDAYIAAGDERANLAVMPSRHRAFTNEERIYRSPEGYVFPPMVMLERGESLEEWRAAPQSPHDIHAMLFDVANHLMCLHSQDRVHRQLSASNILWCEASGAWRLLKADRACAVGVLASLAPALHLVSTWPTFCTALGLHCYRYTVRLYDCVWKS